MTLNKYTVAILQLVILMIAALQAALAEGLSVIEVWQLVGLFLANVGVYIVKVLPGAWAAGLKVGVAVAGAAVTAIIPLVNGYWNAEAFIIVLLAAVSAFAAQFGVDIRVDTQKDAIVSPVQSTAAAAAVDPSAAEAAENQLAAAGNPSAGKLGS